MVILVVASLVASGAALLVAKRGAVEIVSFATAYAGLVLLAATLLTGPLNVMRRRPNPVSTDLRRDLGISAAVLACIHTVLGLQVHMRHRWEYFLKATPEGTPNGLRFDTFGFANDTGLIATILLVVLLAISNDRALARLGKHTWKMWQRSSYVIAVLVIAHGFAYQKLESRAIGGVVVVLAITIVVTVLQLLGRRRWLAWPNARHAPDSSGDAGDLDGA